MGVSIHARAHPKERVAAAAGGAPVAKLAAVALPANALAYVKTDGTFDLADATAVGKEAIGFIEAGVAQGEVASLLGAGNTMTGLSGLTPGASYFLATTPGELTATPPSTAGNVFLKVGVALSATELLFQPEAPITL